MDPSSEPQRVSVCDIDVPLGAMVSLIIKFWIATALALVVLGAAAGVCFVIWARVGAP